LREPARCGADERRDLRPFKTPLKKQLSGRVCEGCGIGWQRSRQTSERYFDALVVFTFASDLEYPDAANLGDVLDVRTAARLQVDTRDPEQTNSPRTVWRLHTHGLDQLRPRVELFVGDPHGFRCHASSDQGIGFVLDPLRI